MNNTSLKEFAYTCVVMEVGRQLSPKGIDATMLISIALKQAIGHYYAYGAELSGIEIGLEEVLKRLNENQRDEIRLSKNKQQLVMAEVGKTLKAFKLQTAAIITYLETNQRQMESASPAAQLKLQNLVREQQGYRALKRLPRKAKVQTAADEPEPYV